MTEITARLATALADRYQIERPRLKPRLGSSVTEVTLVAQRRFSGSCRAASLLVDIDEGRP